MPATPKVITAKDERFLLLDESATSGESSDIIYCPTYRNFSVQGFSSTNGSSTAKAAVEVSLDGLNDGATPVNWAKLHDVGVGEIYSFSGVFSFIRVVHSADTNPLSIQLRRGMVNGADGY